MNKKTKIIASIISILAFGIIGGHSAFASTKDTILKKAEANGVYECYTNGYMKTPQISDKLTKDNLALITGENYVKLPNGYTSLKEADSAVSCNQLFNGYHFGSQNYNGIAPVPDTVDGRNELLEKLGYEDTGKSVKSGGTCTRFYNYQYREYWTVTALNKKKELIKSETLGESSTYWLCSDKLTDITETTNESGQKMRDGVIDVDKLTIDTSDGNDYMVQFEIGAGKVTLDCATYNMTSKGNCGTVTFEKGKTKWSELRSQIKAIFARESGNMGQTYYMVDNPDDPAIEKALKAMWGWAVPGHVNAYVLYSYSDKQQYDKETDTTTEDLTKEYEIKDKNKSSFTATENYTNGLKTYKEQGLTKAERFFLYEDYLFTIYGSQSVCDTDDTTKTAGMKQVYLYDKASGKFSEKCWVRATKNADLKVHGTKGEKDGVYHFSKDIGYDDIIAALNKMKDVKSWPKDVDPSELGEAKSVDGSGDGEESTPDCYTKAASLGWIICPIIDTAADTIQAIYENFIVKFLVLESGLFNTDKDGGANTYQAWQVFQNIANGMFVTTFLYVIFSQLTGVGIDNYGIKKILPKLIIGALLINLSYLICQLAVDVANIVGYGIGAVFDGIGNDVTGVSITEDSASTIQKIGAGGILVALVAAFAVPTILSMGPSIIIPVILGLISILISIITCFVILSIRKALAVLLVAFSPLAFMCYILPNMRKYFSKWLKTFGGLLLAFPICSALINGGQMVSRIVLIAAGGSGDSAVSFTIALSAAFIAIIPIFMIPKVIFSSMGAISGKIAQAGRGVTARAAHGVQHSGFAQDMHRKNADWHLRRAAGVNKDGEETRLGKLKRKYSTAGGKERMAIARASRLQQQEKLGIGGTAEKYLDNYDDQRLKSMTNVYANSSAFTKDTHNGDVDTMMDRMLDPELDLDSMEGKSQFNAYANAMAQTTEGKKALSKAIRNGKFGDADSSAMALLASNGAVLGSLGDKDIFAQEYLKAINTGRAGTAGERMNFDKWSNSSATLDSGATTTNAGKIAKERLDKKDLYSQGGDAFKQALNATYTPPGGGGSQSIIDNNRLNRDLNDNTIDMGDKRHTIENMRGLSGNSTPMQSTVAKAAQEAQAAASSGGDAGSAGDGDAGSGGGNQYHLKPQENQPDSNAPLQINHQDNGGPSLQNPTGNGPSLQNPTGNGPSLQSQPSGGGLNANISGKNGSGLHMKNNGGGGSLHMK